MGGGASHAAEAETPPEWEPVSSFSAADLQDLEVNFRELAGRQGNKDTITFDELGEALKASSIRLKDTVLLGKMFELMDKNDDKEVDFKEFTVCCSAILSSNPIDRIKFSFDMYASDDGKITKDMMLKVLSHVNTSVTWFGDSTSDAIDIKSLVDDVFAEHGEEDGTLKYVDYMNAVVDHPVLVKYIKSLVGQEGSSGEGKIRHRRISDAQATPMTGEDAGEAAEGLVAGKEEMPPHLRVKGCPQGAGDDTYSMIPAGDPVVHSEFNGAPVYRSHHTIRGYWYFVYRSQYGRWLISDDSDKFGSNDCTYRSAQISKAILSPVSPQWQFWNGEDILEMSVTALSDEAEGLVAAAEQEAELHVGSASASNQNDVDKEALFAAVKASTDSNSEKINWKNVADILDTGMTPKEAREVYEKLHS